MRLLPTLLAATICSTASAALAQPPDTPPPAPEQAPPDVVLLRDGGMVRGTILEKSEDSVTIVVAGQQRTISMGDVSYAGPESNRPRTAPAPPAPPEPPAAKPAPKVAGADPGPRTETARIRFTSTPPGLSLQIHTGTGRGAGYVSGAGAIQTQVEAYSNLCISPCDTTLPPGTHRLALSRDRGEPIETAEPAQIPGDSVVSGTYTSRATTRTIGLVTGLGVGAAGILLSSSGISEEKEKCGQYGCYTTSESNDAKMWGGMGIMVAGLAIAMHFGNTPDEAEITVTPMAPAALPKP